MGYFLDFFEIAFIVIRLITTMERKLGVDMMWLTVIIAVVLQISFMYPPLGIALYNLRSAAQATVRTTQIHVSAIPFLAIQLLMVGILVILPGLATTEQVQVRATKQKIEDVLRPPPAESAPKPEMSQPEKK